MGHAAGDNKNAEANEHPVEGQDAPFTNKINKGKWNDEISGRDQKIRDQVQPHQAGVPQVAVALWHETVLTKETREKVHASQTHPCVGNASIPSSTPAGFSAEQSMASPP